MRGCISKIIKDVTSSGDKGPVLFVFLWENIDCISQISNLLSMVNVVLESPFEYVNPFGVAVSLEQTCKFIYSQNISLFCNFAVRMFYQLTPLFKFL